MCGTGVQACQQLLREIIPNCAHSAVTGVSLPLCALQKIKCLDAIVYSLSTATHALRCIVLHPLSVVAVIASHCIANQIRHGPKCILLQCYRRVATPCDVMTRTGIALQGYVVYSRKQKLRPELAKLPNAEIRDRRLAGEVCASCQRSGLLQQTIPCSTLLSHWKRN